MNTFMKNILSILPWVAVLLVIKTVKIKKINRELKTLEQLEEKDIDENNYSIQKEEGWGFYFWLELDFLRIIFVWFYRRTGDFSRYSGMWNIDCFFWNLYPCICLYGESR